MSISFPFPAALPPAGTRRAKIKTARDFARGRLGKKTNKKATSGCAVAGVYEKFRVIYLETGALRESTAKTPPKSVARTEFLRLVSKIAIIVRSFP
jgi:hypothetical protein